ncbi:MAG: Glycerol-3-phosphate regulon repressor [Gammaproteobacteria bacterium]|nr:Glycerol-3-phosphate regulon repressor [Gammaproteobacteria bacterium]
MQVGKRQADILAAAKLRRSCTIAELAEEFGVSDETIRRSVKPLVSAGQLLRVHGGVLLPEALYEPPFERRMQANREAKLLIATHVARHIKDGDSLMLDTGSTTTYVASALGNHRNLFVVTNSAETARILATRNGNRVYMAGGELRADDAAAFGAAANAFVRQFQVQHAILSIGAIDADNGLMDFDLSEAEYARVVLQQAERRIVAADHSKFGRKGFVKVCEVDLIDTLITDRAPPLPLARQFEQAGVEVIVAGQKRVGM